MTLLRETDLLTPTHQSGYLHLFWSLVLITILQACHPSSDKESVMPQIKTADSYSADVALEWSNLHLQLAHYTPGFTPPVASRTFGYAGIALYESVVGGLPDHQSLEHQLQGLTALPKTIPNQDYNWALSANAAQARILRNLFDNTPSKYKNQIDSLETALYDQFKDLDEPINTRSVAYGQSIAQAIFEWSKTDGGHQGYTRNFPAAYIVAVGPGLWKATENGQKIPMQPYWGNNRTFITAVKSLPMPKPILISTDIKSQYFAQYLEVYTKNLSLTQEEKEISSWWSDNPGESFTPPGHSYSLARITVQTAKAPLGKAAETFARVGIAVTDAFIRCWKCKFVYNNERPYTFVRRAIDPTWVPYWPAPPFPGYSSGHATQSAATATVLAGLYGDGFALVDNSHVGRPRDAVRNIDYKARSFSSFWQMAQESALSRFLGGIHTRQDNDTGLNEGRNIGWLINAVNWKK